MSESSSDKSTDLAWEEWGRRDPYFGVITNPNYRRERLDAERKREFFDTGPSHVDGVIRSIRSHISRDFSPQRILDFGCGVGRLLVPFAKIAEEVVGTDVSPSMLEEARRNCDSSELKNVQLLISDDELSTVDGDFDLIHSCIVFQHIPVNRGRVLFSKLLGRIRPGGIAALHLTYSKTSFGATHGVAPAPAASLGTVAPPLETAADPEIQMNPYNLNELMFSMQSSGVERLYTEFTDHGGELGVFMFFSPTLAAYQ